MKFESLNVRKWDSNLGDDQNVGTLPDTPDFKVAARQPSLPPVLRTPSPERITPTHNRPMHCMKIEFRTINYTDSQ